MSSAENIRIDGALHGRARAFVHPLRNVGILLVSASGIRAMAQPNILFLITDQQRADHVGFGGNDIVETPNLDTLAARSRVFRRAYVANPICMPNRASIMTGRMPSVHGTRFNGIGLDWHSNTFVRRLRQHGYRTTHIGKSHLRNMGVNRQRALGLYDHTLAEEARLPSSGGDWNEMADFEHYNVGPEGDFFGFERAAFAIMHGDQVLGHYENWLREKGADPDKLLGPRNALDRYDGWYQIYKSAVPVELHPSSYVADETIDEIARAAQDERPFFIHASWPDPHHPFTPPGHYYDMYPPSAMRLPATFDDPHTDSMPHYRRMISARGNMLFHNVDGWAPTEDQLRHALAAEYGCISLLDACIGRVLDALKTNGVADNTIIVFTSDHGDMFGDHGAMLKHAMHYEGCIRVPLLIAAPRCEAGTTDAFASAIDLAPTLLDLAGVDGFYGMQGHVLSPLLQNPRTSVRDAVYIEEDQKEDMTGAGVDTRMRTLVNELGRLTIYLGHDHGELFAADDALELENLFGRPEAHELQQAMTTQLLQAMLAHGESSPRPSHNA